MLSIEGVDKTTMKDNNMNLIYGDVNYVRYCTEVYKYPSFEKLYKEVEKRELQKVA